MSLPTIAATLIGVIPDMWAAKITCLDRNFSPQRQLSQQKMTTTFRATKTKKTSYPLKKNTFPRNTQDLTIIMVMLSPYFLHSLLLMGLLWNGRILTCHAQELNSSISEWSLVHLLCSSSIGVGFILWLSHHDMPRLNVASWILFPALLLSKQRHVSWENLCTVINGTNKKWSTLHRTNIT